MNKKHAISVLFLACAGIALCHPVQAQNKATVATTHGGMTVVPATTSAKPEPPSVLHKPQMVTPALPPRQEVATKPMPATIIKPEPIQAPMPPIDPKPVIRTPEENKKAN